MPADPKPLFRPEALRGKLQSFALAPAAAAARPRLAGWAKLLESPAGRAKKETELRDEFLVDVFRDLLGYATPAGGGGEYTFRKESLVQVDGTFADAALGRFGGATDRFVAVLEGKGPRDPLDRPHAGRKRSAVDQAVMYAVQLRCDWYLVTNLRQTRLYHKGHDTLTFEAFDLARLAADEAELRRFVFLLGAERVVPPGGGPGHLDGLLAESKKIGRELTNDFYREYRGLRERTFEALRAHNPGRDPSALLAAAQKILDRVLFIAFAEDRDLLPANIVARAYEHSDPFNPRPIWQNFLGLFRSVDAGNPALGISKYNGGLFAPDAALESLAVPDAICLGFKRLADYEYGYRPEGTSKLIDVEILGHIFEQSIADLEELHRALQTAGPSAAAAAPSGPTRRKLEGAFYTPAFVTRYIVAETLGPVLAGRFEALRARHAADAAKGARKALADPRAFDPDDLKPAEVKALAAFWAEWQLGLETVRVVDPACGSGAFLIEAFDQMFAEYARAEDYRKSLGAGSGLFEPKRTILTNNLFGVDLNGEAVEIARLSCWIKTAEHGKVLTSLDDNIKEGNSVGSEKEGNGTVGEVSPIEAWRARFPAAFADGGFDAVIGNPPYVRQEWIKADKPYLERHYAAYDGVADLYVYFYELGLTVLKPGGRLGFIVTNKWMKAGYGEALRRLYGESAWVEQVVDFGHAKQIFPDADVFPCILVARKPTAEPPPETARVCIIPREQLKVDDLSRQIASEGVAVPRERLGSGPWNLEPPGVSALMAKIRAKGIPLREFIGGIPYRGILTGFNEAFLIDTPTKERLVTGDPKSEPLFRRYLRGQDIDRWSAEWDGLWMLAMKSSGNHLWPWHGKAGATAEDEFRAIYPSIHVHLNQFRDQLLNRQDQGENWWELRSCGYWEAFQKPKIMYQEIQFHPWYMLDTGRQLANNKVFFLPTGDLYLLGVLNSPLMWWHNFRYLPHMKDEALTPAGFKMEGLPIPRPTDAQRSEAEAAVSRLIDLTREQQAGRRAVADWLRTEFGVGKPSQKLQDPAALDADGFIGEVRKARKTLSVAESKRLRDEHAASVVPMRALAAEAAGRERRVSDLVNEAFGLTPEEVKLMWATAPPRMARPRRAEGHAGNGMKVSKRPTIFR